MMYRYSEGCFRAEGRAVTHRDLDDLMVEAKAAKLRRARICVHFDDNEPVQEMFVLMMKDSYKGVYKYRKSASLLLLEGSMLYRFYTDGGEPTQTYSMDKRFPYLRIEAGVWHGPTLLSDHVLLYEMHRGPFVQGDIVRRNQFAGMEAG